MATKSLNEYAKETHQIAVDHGFSFPTSIDQTTEVLAKLMLISTEVAEAAEAVRVGDEANLAEELSDVVIRVLDFSYGLGIDLQQAIDNKMMENRRRPYKHGKRA